MNKAQLEERLQLLVNQEVITTHASDVTKLAFESLLDALNVDNVKQSEMVFTHLPIALTRLGIGEAVEEPAPDIMREIKDSPHFDAAVNQVIFIEKKWGENLPQEEKDYLFMHYTNIINIEIGGE